MREVDCYGEVRSIAMEKSGEVQLGLRASCLSVLDQKETGPRFWTTARGTQTKDGI